MSQGISKPQLAEHRYGREEMLALFDITACNLPPESLKELSMVYDEKPTNPLTLQQMSEEETVCILSQVLGCILILCK